MTEAEIASLHHRIENMTEADRLLLDPICEALQLYQRSSGSYANRGFVMANRVAGLAAVDAVAAWEKAVWERE